MSSRYIKAQKREIRRELKQYATGILEYLKPKPKWMPWWLYKFCQETAIHMDKIDPIAKLKNR